MSCAASPHAGRSAAYDLLHQLANFSLLQSRQDDLVQYLQRWLTPAQIDAAVKELRIDLTPVRSANRHKSGMVQEAGQLAGDDRDNAAPVAGVSLDALEDLLDAFAEIRPIKKIVSADVLEKLIDDFVALRHV